MFPPQSNNKGNAPRRPSNPSAGGHPGGQPPPNQGPPHDPFGPGQGPAGLDPFGPAPAPHGGGPLGMSPLAGAATPQLPLPGMPKPGQGMDPFAAMMGGLGMPAPSAQHGPPLGPNGMPIGGQIIPHEDGDDDDMGGSSLLKALAAGLGGGGDPYGTPPMGPDTAFEGIGQGDPQMGAEQLLQLLALGQLGVGGGPPAAGSSGVDTGSFGNMGLMVGMGGQY